MLSPPLWNHHGNLLFIEENNIEQYLSNCRAMLYKLYIDLHLQLIIILWLIVFHLSHSIVSFTQHSGNSFQCTVLKFVWKTFCNDLSHHGLWNYETEHITMKCFPIFVCIEMYGWMHVSRLLKSRGESLTPNPFAYSAYLISSLRRKELAGIKYNPENLPATVPPPPPLFFLWQSMPPE